MKLSNFCRPSTSNLRCLEGYEEVSIALTCNGSMASYQEFHDFYLFTAFTRIQAMQQTKPGFYRLHLCDFLFRSGIHLNLECFPEVFEPKN